jgi:hypothetical protein
VPPPLVRMLDDAMWTIVAKIPQYSKRGVPSIQCPMWWGATIPGDEAKAIWQNGRFGLP